MFDWVLNKSQQFVNEYMLKASIKILSSFYLYEKKLFSIRLIICDDLHDLIPFVQFKKREKHPWWSVTFSKVAG